MLHEIFNHGRSCITAELYNLHILGSGHELCKSPFNRVSVLKVYEIAMTVCIGVAVNGACVVGEATTPKCFGCFGICNHAIRQRNENGMVKSAEILHCCGVDVVNMTNMEMCSTFVSDAKLSVLHQIFDACGLLADCVQTFINRGFVLYIDSTIRSRKEAEVQKFAPCLCGTCGSLKFSGEGEAVCLAVALAEVVFVGITFKVSCVEFAHEAEAVTTICDRYTNCTDIVAVVAHTFCDSCHFEYLFLSAPLGRLCCCLVLLHSTTALCSCQHFFSIFKNYFFRGQFIHYIAIFENTIFLQLSQRKNRCAFPHRGKSLFLKINFFLQKEKQKKHIFKN